MKKLIRAIFVLVLSLVTVALYACDEDKAPALSAEEAIKVLLVEQETYVTGDFDVTGSLFYKGTSYPLTWTSNNTALAVSAETNANGNYTIKVTRPESDKQSVTLTASLTIGEQTATKDFSYNLYPIDVYEISDAYKFAYSNKAIKSSIDLDAKTTYEGKEATITWTVDPASANAVAISNGKVTFDEPTEDTPVKIWAEFSYNGQTAKRPFNLTLIPSVVGPTIVSEFEDGDSFKFGLYQESFGKYLYITGEMSGYYFATTDDASKAADVTVHVVEGGYQLTVGGKYIEILVSGSHNNVVFSDTPSVVWQWDATLKTFTLDIVNPNSASKTGINMLGTSGTYNTLSANLTSKTDAYVAHLYQLPLGPLATPVAGQSYPFAFYQESEGKHMYFTGAMSGYYAAASTDPAEAVNITIETIEGKTGEYHLSFVNAEGKKQYINLVPSGTHTNIKFVDEAPATTWTWNAEYYTYVMNVTNETNPDKSGVYYMGTYGTNKTFGASAISHAATSYVAHMYAPGAELPKPVEMTIEEALAAEDGTLVIVEGTVKTIDTAWDSQFGNMCVTIEDENGKTLYVYRLKTQVEVGDKVIINGKVTSHEGNKQIAQGATAEIVEDESGEGEGSGSTEPVTSLTYTINGAIPTGLEYITNNANYPNPSFYSNGGLKLNYENMGVKTTNFAAVNKVEVTINLKALNAKESASTTKTDVFTVYGLDASGATVATATLTSVAVGDNKVTLEGTGIVAVKVIMTAYPKVNEVCQNANLGGLVLNFN